MWADRLRADDFAFSSDGSLFVATHPANTVVRVSPGGVRSTLVGPEEGCVGATAVLIGRGEVFVTTNGGLLSGGYKGAVTDARVLRLAVRGVKPL